MRPIDRGSCPVDSTGTRIVFRDYAHARPGLIENLGDFCSYCGMQLGASLATEHIRHKDKNPALECEWSNFLLACTNCNSTKGTKIDTQADVDERLWPHLHRTFDAFDYERGGVVRVAKNPTLATRARATEAMVGLSKRPSFGLTQEQLLRGSDRRWKKRSEAWDIATECRQDLRQSGSPEVRKLVLKSVLKLARTNGFWSVWMTVFADDQEVCRQLCAPEVFPGTAQKRVFSTPPMPSTAQGQADAG